MIESGLLIPSVRIRRTDTFNNGEDSIQSFVDAGNSGSIGMTRPSAVSSTEKALLTSQKLHSAISDRISLLRLKVAEATLKAKRRYKMGCNKMVCNSSTFDEGNLFCFLDDSLRRDDNPSRELQPKKTDPFIVVTVLPKTVIFEKKGISGTVSTDLVSIAWQKYETGSPPQLNTLDEYVMNKVVGHSVARGKILYRVR